MLLLLEVKSWLFLGEGRLAQLGNELRSHRLAEGLEVALETQSQLALKVALLLDDISKVWARQGITQARWCAMSHSEKLVVWH